MCQFCSSNEASDLDNYFQPSTSSSTSNGMNSTQSPTRSWLKSIDSVYYLFEDPILRAKYPDLAAKVENGVRLCEEVIQELGLEKTALSFNGGKDCTVVVHMLAAVLRRRAGLSSPPSSNPSLNSTSASNPSINGISSSSSAPLPLLPSVYITCQSPFPTMENFVVSSASPKRYNLEIVAVPGGMKEGLEEYLDGGGWKVDLKEHMESLQKRGALKFENEEELRRKGKGSRDEDRRERIKGKGRGKREVKAIFVGTRRTDPTGATLEPRSPTDEGWPEVERVHPILDWSYQDVWTFLRCSVFDEIGEDEQDLSMDERERRKKRDGATGGGKDGIPYCALYDEGYTSLGSTFNTLPNPILKLEVTPEGSESKENVTSQAQTVGDGTAVGAWKPAYMLEDGNLERAGRIKKKANQTQETQSTAKLEAAN